MSIMRAGLPRHRNGSLVRFGSDLMTLMVRKSRYGLHLCRVGAQANKSLSCCVTIDPDLQPTAPHAQTDDLFDQHQVD